MKATVGLPVIGAGSLPPRVVMGGEQYRFPSLKTQQMHNPTTPKRSGGCTLHLHHEAMEWERIVTRQLLSKALNYPFNNMS